MTPKILSVRRWFLFSLLTIVSGSGCVFTDIRKQFVTEPPKEKPPVIVVGRISVANSWLEKDLHYFKKGLIDWLEEDEGFGGIVVSSDSQATSDAVYLSGTIVTIDEGDEFKRLMIGFGSGQVKVEGYFTLKGADGEPRLEFIASRVYKGGAGIRGPDGFFMGDILSLLGETVAKTVTRWVEGKSID
jgi:uncharacterized protein DUF4410